MASFRLDSIYLDEIFDDSYVPTLTLDSSLNLDEAPSFQVEGEFDITLTDRYITRDYVDIEETFELTLESDYSNYIDLIKLVPTKFQDSVPLQELLYTFGLSSGEWIGKINDIALLVDKYSVGSDYIQFLSDLVGYEIVSNDNTLITEKRRQLDTIIDWYKMKGTYQSLTYLSYLLGINLNVWDLYTTDYTTFVRADWFSGGINQNPGSLSSSYYKSPHIELEILLNRKYGSDSASYLFVSSMYTDLSTYVEKTRPINVVPRYSMYLNCITDTSGDVVEAGEDIQTIAIGTWDAATLRLDEETGTSSGSVVTNQLDESKVLDYTANALFNSITTWKLGIGNVNSLPGGSNFDLETIVATGTVSTLTITSEKVEWEFEGMGIGGYSITELGLYDNSGVLKIASTFPSVEKISGVTFKIKVTLNLQ